VDADRLKPLVGDLKRCMATAMGISEEDILDVSLEETTDGVKIMFSIVHTKEAVAALQSPSFNLSKALMEDDNLASVLNLKSKQAVPRVTMELAFEGVDPDKVDVEALKEALAEALGIPVSEIENLELEEKNGAVVVACTFMKTPEAEEVMNDPEFDIYAALAENPEIAAFLNLTSPKTDYVFPFPVLKPDGLDHLQGEIEEAVTSFTKALAIDEAVHGVRVNSVSPGNIWTPLWKAAADAETDPSAAREAGERVQTLRRMGTILETGRLCLCIAADLTFTTGVDHIQSGGAEIGYGIK
jgi:hypothetical protein